LARIIEQIRLVTAEAESVVSGRDGTDLTAIPRPGSWSVAECIDHLGQTNRSFLPAILKAVGTAPKLPYDRALSTGPVAALLIRNLEPPYHIRYKVLPQLVPQRRDFDSAWTGFLQSQTQLSEAVCSAAGLAIDKVKIQCPVYARITYNIYGAFRMLTAHQRRHVWQIKQTLKLIDGRRDLKAVI
jgi:hypothetical protein